VNITAPTQPYAAHVTQHPQQQQQQQQPQPQFQPSYNITGASVNPNYSAASGNSGAATGGAAAAAAGGASGGGQFQQLATAPPQSDAEYARELQAMYDAADAEEARDAAARR
jgi:hypothetical protein